MVARVGLPQAGRTHTPWHTADQLGRIHGDRIPRCRSTLTATGARSQDSRRKGSTVPENVELTVRLHSVSGEDAALTTRDFGGAAEALDAIGHALNERRSLTLTRARSNGEAREYGVVINLANIVFLWVYATGNASVETGQYI